MSPIETVLADIKEQLLKNMQRWPAYNSAHEAYGVITEEHREFEAHVFTKQSKRDLVGMRRELVDIAAVAVRAIMDVCDGGRGRV